MEKRRTPSRGRRRRPVHKRRRDLEWRGRGATERIVKLAIGQGYGFIRLADGREVYVHRTDVHERTIVTLGGGDPVTFEWFEDGPSGARALRVRPHGGSRAGG